MGHCHSVAADHIQQHKGPNHYLDLFVVRVALDVVLEHGLCRDAEELYPLLLHFLQNRT